jgi:surface antigen
MKVAKIADLQDLADGTVVGEMVFQIKSAFAPKAGQGKYGPWRVVPAIVKDQTGEIRCSFWTQKDIQSMTGQTITVKSHPAKHGMAGIKAKFSQHSGKNELDIREPAEIIDGTRNALEQYTDAVKVNTQLAQAKGSVQDAKRLLFQKAQLYVECVKAADWIKKQHDLTVDHFQAVVASLFISADKQNLANCFPVEAVKPNPVGHVEADEIPMNFEEADAAAKPKKNEFEEETGW